MKSQHDNNFLKGIITATKIDTINFITNSRNKHMIPLANKPMIQYAIEKLIELDVKEIGIIIDKDEKDIQRIVSENFSFSVSIQYITQDENKKGIVGAIYSAMSFLGDSPFVVFLGDNIIIDDIRPIRDEFFANDLDCMLLLNKTKKANQFGVPVFDNNNKIIKIEERPVNPKSEYAVCGVYFYKSFVGKVFDQLNVSQRGVYEISEMHSIFIQNGYSVGYKYIKNWWKDRGSVDDILSGNRIAFDSLVSKQNPYQNKDYEIKIEGYVQIDSSSVISGNTVIHGPVVIGKQCLITNSYIGPYTSVGNGVELHNSNIQNSILYDSVSITTTNPISDSILGYKSIVNDSPSPFDYRTQLVVGDNSTIYL